MATKDIIKHLIKVTENDFASVVSAGIVGDCSTFVDTGSYSLNALLSGSLYGGVPAIKIKELHKEQFAYFSRSKGFVN